MNPLFYLGGFFLFVLATVSLAGYFLYQRMQASEAEADELPAHLSADSRDQQSWLSVPLSLLHALGQWMPSSEASRIAMQRRLNYAGWRNPSAYHVWFGAKCAAGVLLALVLCIAAIQTRDQGNMVFAAAVCGLGLGFLLPERLLDAKISRRNNRLRRALPATLDLIVMSLEAGQNLDQAVLLASRTLQKLTPELCAEFMTVYLETRASKSRAEAIRNMYDRNNEPELRKLCNLMLDSDRFGSSLAPTLRQHARFLRIRFRQRAQEAARKLSVKMVFPVFFLIFPAILVVTLGPAVLMMMRFFEAMRQ